MSEWGTEPAEQDEGPHTEWHAHEALHTTWMLLETFSRFVIEARTCREFPEVMELAEEAHEKLFDLYQMIGEKRWKVAVPNGGDAP